MKADDDLSPDKQEADELLDLDEERKTDQAERAPAPARLVRLVGFVAAERLRRPPIRIARAKVFEGL